jgi:hypothetical protein
MTQPDPNAQSGEGAPQSDASGAGDGGTTDAGTQSGTGAAEGASTAATGQTARERELETQAATLLGRMQAADRRASTLEAELRQLKDKDLPEIEKLKRDTEDYKRQAETAKAELSQARIQIAFLSDNTYEWHDPKMALKAIDTSKLDIADDGTVSGLKLILDGLAKESPWMVKPKADDSGGQSGAPGTPPMNSGGTGTGAPDAKTMKRRFPALGSRLGG